MAAHIEEHRGLLEALTCGDDARAADVARRHVIGFDQAIRAVL
jgi:DNA-binding GntR family transcriptional regulator